MFTHWGPDIYSLGAKYPLTGGQTSNLWGLNIHPLGSNIKPLGANYPHIGGQIYTQVWFKYSPTEAKYPYLGGKIPTLKGSSILRSIFLPLRLIHPHRGSQIYILGVQISTHWAANVQLLGIKCPTRRVKKLPTGSLISTNLSNFTAQEFETINPIIKFFNLIS